ncbi:hypothetical protein NX059_011643 [Plenodomus lindquistii]|nr:hypothetical protein NX059_011643 [Plenodomus lindquistii]
MHFLSTALLSALVILGAAASVLPRADYGIWRDVSITFAGGESVTNRSEVVTAEYDHPELTEPIYATCQMFPIVSGEDFARIACHPESFYYSLVREGSADGGNLLKVFLAQKVELGGEKYGVSGTSETVRQSCGGGEKEVCLVKGVTVIANTLMIEN